MNRKSHSHSVCDFTFYFGVHFTSQSLFRKIWIAMSFLTRKVRFNEILTAHRLQKQLVALTQACNASHKSYIGTRDVVGHGFNGNLRYFDAVDMPYPAIRFREETKQISKLREKEKGDWKNLSLEEKKQCLYFQTPLLGCS